MVVALQNELSDFKAELENAGFTVVDYKSYKFPIDALIYIDDYSSIAMNSECQNPSGILMVNARGLDISNIIEVLKNRTYTPLL